VESAAAGTAAAERDAAVLALVAVVWKPLLCLLLLLQLMNLQQVLLPLLLLVRLPQL
jgi:hypothetical protein